MNEIDVLKKPLVFGDSEQIREVRRLEREATETEEAAKKDTYEVTINFSGSFTTEVQASDEDEAREVADSNWNLDEADIDTESVEIRKIKSNRSNQ